jgi:hypothetical protein
VKSSSVNEDYVPVDFDAYNIADKQTLDKANDKKIE